MAYDEFFADRIRLILKERKANFRDFKMMGGLCFMVNDKMCVGVMQDKTSGEDKLMARVDPERYEELLEEAGSREMDFTGRPMRGFLFIQGPALDKNDSLEFWVDQCLEYNPRAKSSKKKSKKK